MDLFRASKMAVIYKVHKTRMKLSTINLVLFTIIINIFFLTADAEYIYEDDELPEVLHHLTPFYNFSTIPPKDFEAIIRTSQFWADRPNQILNETSYPNGRWAATHDIDMRKMALYVEENELEYIYICRLFMHNFEGFEQVFDCFNWTKDDAFLVLNKNNPSVWYKSIKPKHDYFLAAEVIITAIGVFGNSLIIVVLVKYKNMKNPTNLLLGSLAVNDLLVTGLYPALMMYQQFWIMFLPAGDLGCNFLDYTERILFVNSVFHLTAVSFERFFAICMAMKVKTICTMKRAKILAPSLWICAAIASIPSMFTKKTNYSHYCIYPVSYSFTDWFGIHKSYELGILVGIPLLLVLHNYTRIIITLVKSLRQNAALMEGSSSNGSQRSDNEDVKKRMKVVKMLVSIVTVFIVCWMPRLIFDVFIAIDSQTLFKNHGSIFVGDLQAVLYTLSYVNSAVNAPIYYLTSNQFNKAFKRALTCGRLGKDERVTSMITQSSMASTTMTEKPSVNNPSRA